MLTLEDQFVVEEAWMAKVEAKLAKQKVELARLQKKAQEEVRWKEKEEQRRKEEEERVAKEQKWKEEEEKKRRDEEQKRKEEADRKAEERRCWEVEEWKRAEEEKKQREEEEHRRHVATRKEKQSETKRQGNGENGEDAVEEVEWRKQAEVQIREQRVSKQMARAAQAESSKQATHSFTWAALAYWRSRGVARFNQPYVEVGPIGTNHHISLFLSSRPVIH